jgi:hypothetical protein
MNLPYSDPSNPALPSPLFSDVTAVRGDHMRANNAAIFANFDFLIDLLNEFFTDSDQLTVDEILEKTADAGVTIDGVVCKDGVVTGDLTGNADTATQADGVKETGSGACVIHKKIIEIGDWNMQTSESVFIAHHLDADKIRFVRTAIRNDANSAKYPLNFSSGGTLAGVDGAWDATTVRLTRVSGGFFDSTDFNSNSYNRGWITIEYID